jgi:hypothetical protein
VLVEKTGQSSMLDTEINVTNVSAAISAPVSKDGTASFRLRTSGFFIAYFKAGQDADLHRKTCLTKIKAAGLGYAYSGNVRSPYCWRFLALMPSCALPAASICFICL